jgi:hypothetical protein
MPLARLENGSWPHPALLPLGGGWSGYCTAPQHQNESPSQDVLETFCNLGYAGACTWAPQERKWDAVRFAITARSNLQNREKNDSSRVIHLCYVCERDHRPVERGDLEFDAQQCRWLKPHEDARVQKMAECFLKSRLTRND